MKSKTSKNKKQSKKISIDARWELVNPHAAGVDIGSREHLAAVPPQAGKASVRQFGAFPADLEAMAEWFKECGVTSVAMESTGVYWKGVRKGSEMTNDIFSVPLPSSVLFSTRTALAAVRQSRIFNLRAVDSYVAVVCDRNCAAIRTLILSTFGCFRKSSGTHLIQPRPV